MDGKNLLLPSKIAVKLEALAVIRKPLSKFLDPSLYGCMHVKVAFHL